MLRHADQIGFTSTAKRHIASTAAAVMAAMLLLTAAPGLYTRAAEAPQTVTGLGIQVSSSPTATLSWNKVDCDGYKVCRNKRVIARVKPGTSDSRVSFVDEGIEPGKTYTYSVKAYRNENDKEICSPHADPVKIIDGYTFVDAGDGSIKLTGYAGQEAKLLIPDALDGKKVTEIGDGCFSGNPWVERVYVPEGVTKIGDYGFECCSRMEKIFLPDSLRTVGNGAFSGCGVLKLADFGDGVTSIGDGAFMACQSLRQISLPADLRTLGKFAFALCNDLTDVTFKGNQLSAIPERTFDSCMNLEKLSLPDSVTSIGKRAFYNCEMLTRIDGGPVKEIGDYAFERSGIIDIYGILDDGVSLGFGLFAKNETDKYYEHSFEGNEKQLDIPASATLTEGTFYGSPINGISLTGSENANYKLINGSLYTSDGKTLVAYFPTALNEDNEYEKTDEADANEFHVPDGVTRIAPYAFFECRLDRIYLPSSLTEIADHAFTRSGIAPDLTMLVDYNDDPITEETEGIHFGDNAFYLSLLTEDSGLGTAPDPGTGFDPGTDPDPGTDSGTDNSNDTNDSDPFQSSYTINSLAGDKNLYRPEDFAGYSDISDHFTHWCKDYIEDNKTIMPFDMDLRLWIAKYCSMYKSDQHYNQMAVTLNGDTDWAPEALKLSGHEYEEMYLMADHGISTELSRAKIQDDLVLYSGITDAFARRILNLSPGTQIETDDLIAGIGSEYEEKAMMSTSASFNVSYGFAGDAGVMAIILASHDALNSLGTFCLDCFMGSEGNGGEYEILLDAGARFRVLDVGTAETEIYGQPGKRTYIMMELLEDKKDTFELTDEECKCDNEEDEPEKEDVVPEKEDKPEKEDVVPEKEETPEKKEPVIKDKKGWVKTKEGWKYRKADGSFAKGWLQLGDRWFYLNDDGIMQTGWQDIDGARYYFDEEGVMLTGWHEIDGIWYYFSDSGALKK